MKLIPNAKRVAWRAHSMWANYLGIACLVAPELIYAIAGRDTNPRLWWIAGIALIVYGIIGRLKDQGMSRSPASVAVIALVMSLSSVGPQVNTSGHVSEADFLAEAVPLVARWEGKRNRAYLDTIAHPPVWTVCHGETRGVREGDYYTDSECADMLGRAILGYRKDLHSYFLPETIRYRLTAARDAAYTSLAYNAGVRAIGKSTATRRLNAGDISGGCAALRWWNKAGGRVIRGLVNRRAEEYALCMRGLA